MVDRSTKAIQHYSDAYPAYSEICYKSSYLSLKNKSQTYTVEDVNYCLSHYIIVVRATSIAFLSLLISCCLYLKFSFFVFNKFALAKFNFSSLKPSLSDFI